MAKIDFSRLTRDQAKAIVGEQAVNAVDKISCEFHQAKPEGYQIWTSSLPVRSDVLTAYYEPLDSEFYNQDGEAIEDLGELDWKVDHYSLR